MIYINTYRPILGDVICLYLACLGIAFGEKQYKCLGEDPFCLITYDRKNWWLETYDFHTCTKNLTEISVYKVMNNNGQQKEKRKRLEKETGRGFFLFSPSL